MGCIRGFYSRNRRAWDRFLLGDAPSPRATKHVQVFGGLTGSVGYVDYVGAYVSARIGSFRSEFWEHLPGVLNKANHVFAAGGHRGRKMELFLAASARPRPTLYIALLQGQFRRSAVIVPAPGQDDHYERLVARDIIDDAIRTTLAWVER